METKLPPTQNPGVPTPPAPTVPPTTSPPPAANTSSNTPPSSPKRAFPKPIALLLIVAGVIAIAGIALSATLLFRTEEKAKPIQSVKVVPTPKPQPSISGTIGINGAPPSGSIINVMARKEGEVAFKTVAPNVTPIDGTSWSWNAATPGQQYELQAVVTSSGQTIGESSILSVAAPASGEVLHVTVTAPPTPTTTPTTIPSSISGTINLNGYTAPGTTINIAARQVGTQNFVTVVSNLPAVNNSSWSWTSAIQNQAYEVQAILSTGSSSQSQVIDVTAPAANEILTINSTATPPAPVVTGLSGTINLNGTIPSGAYITLGTRVTGTATFNQVASNISATNGTAWSWSAAAAGTSYDIQAYLWINNQPASQSQILTVAAPATGEVLTINSVNQPPAPTSNSISGSCQNNGSGYQATINFNQNNPLLNAQMFWLTVGTTGGGNQVISNTIAPSNPSQTQSYTTSPNLSQGQTYYAQYAYSTCTNCNTFSPFSASAAFTCN